MKEKRKSKSGRNPKLDPAVYRYTVRFNEEEHNRFLAMFGKSGVYARSVFLKAHFFGQPFKVLKVDKTLVDYYTKLSDFHAQFRAVGTNYNQVVKELRLHFSEKKAMALLYKLDLNSSILALSSNYEGFGLVLIEAMSLGVPCVSFDCPFGPSEIIRNQEDGLLVKNGDIQGFANAICHHHRGRIRKGCNAVRQTAYQRY